jgi:hypothetical protein
MVGPIGASDPVARTLTVLGQPVDIDGTTVFDDTLASGQAALAVGDVVEVYASVDPANGHYLATRIERKTAALAFALRGIVANLDPVARSFTIGATRISYAGVNAANVPAMLANGSLVRVALGLLPNAGVWSATAVGDGSPALDDHDQAKVEGLISAFTSSAQFSVDGTPVDARLAQFPDGAAGLALGKRVEVEGATLAGVLIATRVRVISDSEEHDQEFDVRGTITALDAVAKIFVVRSVTVSYAGPVDFRNGSAAALVVGSDVEARGMLSPDGTRLQATRIDFRH